MIICGIDGATPYIGYGNPGATAYTSGYNSGTASYNSNNMFSGMTGSYNRSCTRRR